MRSHPAPFVRKSTSRPGLVLTCEHASNRLPGDTALGAPEEMLATHRGYDLGARQLSQMLLKRLGGELVASRYSRLYVDLNRDEDDPECIPEHMDSVRLSGNRLSSDARRLRLEQVHRPYHRAVDQAVRKALGHNRRAFLLSVHSFTPVLHGQPRNMEVGVLFDRHEKLARRLVQNLAMVGFSVEENQPYSGLDGLIYSANRHGNAHEIPYLEIEVRNDLLGPCLLQRTAERLLRALRPLLQARLG